MSNIENPIIMDEKIQPNDDKDHEGNGDLTQLFKKYYFTENEIKIFNLIKSELLEEEEDSEDIKISNEHIIWCIITKKTFEKSIKLVRNFRNVLNDFLGIREFEAKEIHFRLLSQGYFFFDDRIHGLENEECVLFAKSSKANIDQFEDRTVIEAHSSYLERLGRYSAPNSFRKGFIMLNDLSGFSLFKIPWKLKKTMAPILNKLPFRIKMVLILHPPSWFNIAWKIAKSLGLTQKITYRIILVKNVEELKKLNLMNYIPKELGGEYEVDPIECLRKIYCQNEKERNILDEMLKKERGEENSEEEEDEGESSVSESDEDEDDKGTSEEENDSESESEDSESESESDEDEEEIKEK